MSDSSSNGNAKHGSTGVYLDKLSTAIQVMDARLRAIEAKQAQLEKDVMVRLELLDERFDQIDTLVQSAKLVRTTM